MSAVPGTKRRGHKAGTVPLFAEVPKELKEIVDRTHQRTGMSKAQVTEEILRRVPVDDTGVAVWAQEWMESMGRSLPAEPLPIVTEALSA